MFSDVMVSGSREKIEPSLNVVKRMWLFVLRMRMFSMKQREGNWCSLRVLRS